MSEPRPPSRRGAGAGNQGRPASARRAPSGSGRPASSSRRSGARPPGRRTYKPVRRLPLSPSGGRLRVTIVVMAVALVLCGLRLVQLQGLDPEAYAARADQESLRLRTLPAQRGTITDRNGQVLAATEPAVNVFCDPTVITGERESAKYRARANERRMTIAGVLAHHLGGSPYDYLSSLTRADTRNSSIRKKVPARVYRGIADDLYHGGLAGIYKEENPVRSYPAGALAGNVVGFVNAEGVGSAGLEAWFDPVLSGNDGEESYDVSRYGRIPLGANVRVPAQDGRDVVTTIDGDLQATMELALGQAVERSGAESGFMITMNVRTGEVLGLASTPAYDPGRYGTYDQTTLGLKAISDAYEPGSVQKVLTFAAAADLGLITPETRLDIPSRLMSGGDPITDLHEHPARLNARGALVWSSNIGTTMIGRQMSREQYFDYMDSFGLGNKTGIQLPGEGTGEVDYDMTEAQRDRAAFGQSLSVTGIQEAAAIAAIANGGIYNPPTIVRQIAGADGRLMDPEDKRTARRVISAEAAAMTMDMMENVVTDEHYTLLPISGYRLAGKTGTAERYEPTCGCYRGNTVSYAGIGSAENPSLLVYLVVDKPQGEPSGYFQAGPAVSDIMKVALPRYGVPVSTTPPRKDTITW